MMIPDGRSGGNYLKSLFLMSGIENRMTLGDPYKMEVIAYKEVSEFIVIEVVFLTIRWFNEECQQINQMIL